MEHHKELASYGPSTFSQVPGVLKGNVQHKTVLTEFQPREEIVHWKIRNFKDSIKFFQRKDVIRSRPFECGGCIWELRLTSTQFSSDFFLCDLALLYSDKPQIKTVFKAHVNGIENDIDQSLPQTYVPASPHQIVYKPNAMYTYEFHKPTSPQGNDDESAKLRSMARVMKTNRNSIFEQEDVCLVDGELTVVLELSVLEESAKELSPASFKQPTSLTFAHFFDNDQFSDFTITGREGLNIKAHKFLLANCSPYFLSMMNSHMVESERGMVCLNHDDPKTLKRMIQFLYSQDLSTILPAMENNKDDLQDALDLLAISDKYQIDNLRNSLEEHLLRTMTPKTALQILPVAAAHGRDNLRSQATHLILLKMPSIMHDFEADKDLEQEWLTFSKDNTRQSFEITRLYFNLYVDRNYDL